MQQRSAFYIPRSIQYAFMDTNFVAVIRAQQQRRIGEKHIVYGFRPRRVSVVFLSKPLRARDKTASVQAIVPCGVKGNGQHIESLKFYHLQDARHV